jgi:CRISPR-associated endonuclease Cas1
MHSLVLNEQGTQLAAEGDCLVVWRGSNRIRQVRVRELDQVLLMGHIDVTHGALMLLLRRGVDVVWLTQTGSYRGRLVGTVHKNSLLRIAQYRRTVDNGFALTIARRLVASKIHQQRQLLLRAQRRLKNEDLASALSEMRLLIQRAEPCSDLEELRGWEGRAAALYFQHFGLLISNPDFTFHGRTRRPPRDEVNALLSFGYAVLGSVLQSEIYACGLDPMLGFFHQPLHGRPALMLDILELYRPWIDQLVLRLVNRRQVGRGDFERYCGQSVEEILSSQGSDEEVFDAPPWEEDGTADGQSPQPSEAASEAPPTTPLANIEQPAVRSEQPTPREASQTEFAPHPDLLNTGPNFNMEAAVEYNSRHQPSVAEGTGFSEEPPFDVPASSAPSTTDIPNARLASNATQISTATVADTTTRSTLEVAVLLNETGRKVFFAEFLRKLREERYYPKRNGRFSTKDIIRFEIYHLARAIESDDDPFDPFILDER